MPKNVNRIETNETFSAPTPPTTVETQSTFEQLETEVEKIRQTLRTVLVDLNGIMKVIGQAHKEKRATDREIKSFRESLKEIQSIQI